MKIVGECSSGKEAAELVLAITPDILLTEVVMPCTRSSAQNEIDAGWYAGR